MEGRGRGRSRELEGGGEEGRGKVGGGRTGGRVGLGASEARHTNRGNVVYLVPDPSKVSETLPGP